MTNTETTAAPQPDMQALMAKVAKLQKILGFLTWSQALMGVLLLAAPFWLTSITGMQEPFAFLALAPFFLGLAYVADFAKKDLTHAKAAFRNTAIAQMGLNGITLVGILVLHLHPVFWGLYLITLVMGGLPVMVIRQALKEQKG